jgi:hypothetical protein
MVAGGLSSVIDSELHAIRVIYDEHARRASSGTITGFGAIHVRSQPARPLPDPLSLRQVLRTLPQPERQYDGVAFNGATGVAVGSFCRVVRASQPLWPGRGRRDRGAVPGQPRDCE